jgi:hypothetical protein
LREDCPVCGHRNEFVVGPAGGAGVDLLCTWCEHEFVAAGFAKGWMFSQRLGKCHPARLRAVYNREPKGGEG